MKRKAGFHSYHFDQPASLAWAGNHGKEIDRFKHFGPFRKELGNFLEFRGGKFAACPESKISTQQFLRFQ